MDLAAVFDNASKFDQFFSTDRKPWTDTQILIGDCCASKCHYFLTRYDVLHVRSGLVSACNNQSANSQTGSMSQTIKSFINQRSALRGNHVKLDSSVNGTHVCYKLFSRILNMSIERIESTLAKAYGDITDVHGRIGTYNPSAKSIEVASRCLTVCGRFGQFDPRGGIILPPTVSKKELFNNRSGVIIRRHRIDKILQLQIRLRKRDSFLNCNLCVAIRAECETSNLTRLQQTIRWRNVHSLAVVRERCYVSHVEQMSREHEDILLLKIDACGKARTKALDGLSFTNYDYLSIFDCLNTSSTDYIVTALLKTLDKLTHIPTTLFINLDNVLIQKSKTFFGSMGILMQLLPFTQIILFYNSCGHTHSSVDAHFGSLKRKLDVVDCFTPNEMANVLNSIGYTEVNFLNYSYKIKEVVDEATIHYQNRHNYHHFRIYRDAVKFDADEILNNLIPINHRSVISGEMLTGTDKGLCLFNTQLDLHIGIQALDARKLSDGAMKLKKVGGGYWNDGRDDCLNETVNSEELNTPDPFLSLIDRIKRKMNADVSPISDGNADEINQMNDYFNKLGYKTSSRARPGGLKPDRKKRRVERSEENEMTGMMDEAMDDEMGLVGLLDNHEDQLSERSLQL